ncbi:MAG: ribonuclease P protein component 1 [Candidatus Helarchaeota archaeon]
MVKNKRKLDNKFRINEFIGLDVEIIESTNRFHVGLKGKIIDESYNMLIISSGNKIKKIPKKNCIFKFKSKSKPNIILSGSDILGRPEDRIKKSLRKNRI